MASESEEEDDDVLNVMNFEPLAAATNKISNKDNTAEDSNINEDDLFNLLDIDWKSKLV